MGVEQRYLFENGFLSGQIAMSAEVPEQPVDHRKTVGPALETSSYSMTAGLQSGPLDHYFHFFFRHCIDFILLGICFWRIIVVF